VENTFNLPKPERLSVITAGILVCYASLPLVQVTAREVSFLLIGIQVAFRLNYYNLISVITAVMAASGMEWLLFDHPSRGNQNTLPHLILPALTAAAIGYPLGLIGSGAAWWVILALGSVLVVLVLISEYISLELRDIRYPLAMMVLSGTSYSLLLILTIALRSADLRLYQMLLLLPVIYTFFSLRVLNFRLGGRWRFEWAAIIGLVITQVLIALYYWPLSPVRFGLLLLGPSYALTGIAASLEEKPDLKKIFLEPLIMLGILWMLAIFIS
jgi:hypothetical protein